jgi:flagellar L-ring protein precursor FlgH
VRHTVVLVATLALTGALTGCGSTGEMLTAEPRMTGVGETLPAAALVPQPATYRAANSTFVHGGEDLFRDSRATRVGDVLTVVIRMTDKAELDNSSSRSRTSSVGFDTGFGFKGKGAGASADFDGSINSTSKSAGDGAIERSEDIKVTLAAVVTQVLPNGNLLISGSQEMRVNHEMRVVNVQGIVRQRDISGRNTIPYEKIAEARISYGGSGRLSEVQQPGFLHQIYDRVTPF